MQVYANELETEKKDDKNLLRSKTVEVEHIGKKGNIIPCEIKMTFIRDTAGHPTGILGYTRDITDRKRAEEALKLHSAVLETVAEGIFLIGLEDNIIKWTNREFEELFGYDPGEMLGMHVDKVNAPTEISPSETRISIVDILRQDGEWHGEITNIKKDGTLFWSYIHVSLFNHPEFGTVMVSAHTDITERKQAEKELQHTLDSLKRAINTTIQVMVTAVETRDPYTAGHQNRSANLARAIATEMGLSQDKIDGISMAGSIHDIGKLSIPAEILSKPTNLTEIEFPLIKEHAKKGFEMLKDVESPWPLAEIVYQHHERMDGSGYPRHLKGEEILIEARILAVADVVESMASHRPYRPALGLKAALEEVENNKGTLYDANAVDACLRLFRGKGFQLDGI